MSKHRVRSPFILMIVALAALLLPPSANASRFGDRGPAIQPEPAIQPGPVIQPGPFVPAPAPVPLPQIAPLPSDFEAVIKASPLTTQYQATFAALGWTLSFNDGYEFFVSSLGVVPKPPRDARAAFIPLLDGNGFGVAAYAFTYGTSSGIEGAEVIEILAGTGEAGANTMRAYMDPGFETHLDMQVNSAGEVSGVGGSCSITVPVQPIRFDASFASRAESCGDYWWCVGDWVVRMALIGQSTGLSEACVAACLAGGLANPACDLCIVGGIAVLGGAWWDCW